MTNHPASLYSVFRSAAVEIGELDTRYLLRHVIQGSMSMLYTRPETQLTEQQLQEFQALVERRKKGEPIAYLTGERGFWSLDLQVNQATLIPRPETELLVEVVLEKIKSHVSVSVLDLGTGSGAIALAIAKESPKARVIAVDFSEKALQVARENAHRHSIDNVEFVCSDWFSAIDSVRADVIVSNPPYIAENDPHLIQGDVRFEPVTALVSGKDGLDAIRLIVQDAPMHLNKNGWLFIEHGYDQAEGVRQLMSARGFSDIESRQDIELRDRVTLGQWSI